MHNLVERSLQKKSVNVKNRINIKYDLFHQSCISDDKHFYFLLHIKLKLIMLVILCIIK